MPESNFERNLWELRLAKLQQIGALGVQQGLTYADATYPNSYPITTTIGALRARYIDGDAPATAESLEATRVEAAIAGRVMQIRVQGKAGFAQLQGDGLRLQIYVRKDDVGEQQFAIFKLLDLGDHIGVTGYLFITRTGETTLHVTSLRFLTKALLALPDKYHGLEDVELRYRQRYVDLFMNTGQTAKQTVHAPAPEVLAGGESQAGHEAAPPNVREVFVKRAQVLKAIRKFFDERGYLEVETPMMHPVAGGAAAKPFTTRHNTLGMDLYLRIAPELYLKRLVVGGLDKVYEINRNFRNEGISTQHNPEFTMLEFYQAYANYQDLMELTEELVSFVAEEVNASKLIEFNGEKIDLGKWTRLTMQEAIRRTWQPDWGDAPSKQDFSNLAALWSCVGRAAETLRMKFAGPKADSVDRPRPTDTTVEHFLAISRIEQNIRVASEAASGSVSTNKEAFTKALGDNITALFEAVAEKALIQPTIIYDFPRAVSPLSKPKPDEPDWVERFEFYIGGFEIGNAFSELNDPVDQRERFEAQVAAKAKGDDEAHEMDEDYLNALSYGLPPTAGEGIGIDRLVMILTGQRSIRDVILFPLLRPQATKTEAGPPPAVKDDD